MEIQTIKTSLEEVKTRLDKVLMSYLEDVSRTNVQNWIKNGNVLVNGEAVKASYKIEEGDVIEVFEEREVKRA